VKHLAWASDLPIGWAAKPLRALADYWVSNVDKIPAEDEAPVRLCNYSDVYKNEFVTLDLDFMQSTATIEEIKRFRLLVGDVVITKDSESWDDIAVPALICESAEDLVCGYHLALIRPKADRVLGRFLFRCLQAKPVRSQLELAASDGVTRFGVPKSEIGGAWVPVPPRNQQQAIADYLDRETARLDALIAAKERLLGLLAEKRQALITRAVTRGLDPNAPLRDSGIPWLGPIPAHWKVERLKFHLRGLEQGWSPQCENLPAEDGEWGVMKAGCVNGWIFDPTENKRLPNTEAPLAEYEIRCGDVLMSRANTTELLGSAALVTEVRPRLLLCDKLYRLDVDDSALKKAFLVAFLRSRPGRYAFEREATGASNSMQNIGQDTVRNLWVPIPPLDEQSTLLRNIQFETQRLDALNAATERTIALLKERRSALIAAAVTGQIPIPPEPVP
jgi:type I restriction enzyme S subunit